MILQGRTALVVDDDHMHLEILRRSLEGMFNCKVIVANNGREAQETLRTGHVDIVFSDIIMSPGDGWELITFIRNNPALATTPVIATTARCMEGNKEETLAAGYNGFISKPFGLREFESQLNTILLEF